MNETLEIGRHLPYIIAAYSVSALIIGALIVIRLNRLRRALDAEQADKKK